MNSALLVARSFGVPKCRKTLEERPLSCYNSTTNQPEPTGKITERMAKQQRKNNQLTEGCHPVMVRVQRSAMTPARMIRPIIIVCGLFYLSYHALHGERGLSALIREQHERSILQTELQEKKQQREAMELKVSHLRDGSLDLDLLDEQMRRMLGVMKPGEIVVMQGDKS